MRETREERYTRLRETEQGRALLSLLDQYGTLTALAEFCGVSLEVVVRWVDRGFISTRGAIKLESLTGRMKEEFRPDLSAKHWDCPRGPVFGDDHRQQEWEGDAKLLVEAAKAHGGTTRFCKKAGIPVGSFHVWKYRNKIPAIKLPIILALAGVDTETA